MGSECSRECSPCTDAKLPTAWRAPEPQGLVEEQVGGSRPSAPNAIDGCYFTRELYELEEMKTKTGLQLKDSESYEFRTGAVYRGQWQDNGRHGFGTQVWKDGARFTGFWARNLAEGKFVHANGDIFVGHWKNNAAHGIGKYIHSIRTFLQAGAAAGTVARSISAYDMKMSDVNYGKAQRYVTQERLKQMLDTEYNIVEKNLRSLKGEDARFFAFADTLAAKAFNSNRECEGWIGLTYQAKPKEARSTVILHIRMSQPTAQLQGQEIGVLGTNLIYLCKSLTDPYLITSFLLDGMSIRDDEGGGGRIEIDFVDFQGPAFKGVDPRLVAFRLIQLRIANGVILEPGSDGKYKMAVPNNFLYKRPVIVERSRFRPPTRMHKEVIEAAARKLKSEGDTDKEALKIMNLQIDDLTVPTGWQETKERLERMKAIAAADTARDGLLSREEFMTLTGEMEEADANALFKELSLGGDSISVDALMNITNGGDSVLATDFIDRMEMLQALKYPIILSNFKRNHQLARYLSRYTALPIIIAVGGGGYDLQRALFNPKSYSNEEGGMLRAFGNLFESRSNRIFTYPAIDEEGNVSPCDLPDGNEQQLYQYLESIGSIVPLGNAWVGVEARDPAKNKAFRYGSESVTRQIKSGSSEWEEYVPEGVAAICKSHAWFSRVTAGTPISPTVYRFLNNLK